MKATKFQKDSAKFIFERLFKGGNGGCNRFLLADEPGLGKTVVTREVISYLREKYPKKKLRIIYICSNSGIISQNTSRLMPEGVEAAGPGLASVRLTTWPLQLVQHRSNPFLIIPFTPGTALYLSRSQGIYSERIYLLLILLKVFPGMRMTLKLSKLFRGQVRTKKNWIGYIKDFRTSHRDALENLSQDTIRKYRRNFLKLGLTEERIRSLRQYAEHEEILDLLNRGRQALALAAIEDLAADLIIMDEFQRFRNVMTDAMPVPPESDRDLQKANPVISRLFQTQKKVLMVSATPFKMLTTYSDSEGDDHHQNVLDVYSFLCENNIPLISKLQSQLAEYRRALFHLNEASFSQAYARKKQLEDTFKKHIIRTERVTFLADFEAGINEVFADTEKQAARFKNEVTMQSLIQLRNMLRAADEQQFPRGTVLGYWKSAGYLPNVMTENSYELVKRLDKDNKMWPVRIMRLLRNANYHELANLQANYLRRRYFDELEAHKALWLPPTYTFVSDSVYAKENSMASRRQFGKTLVFSSWRFVPRFVSAFLSLEADKRLGLWQSKGESSKSSSHKASLLNFSPSRQSTFFVCFPSYTLAELLSVRDFLGESYATLFDKARTRLREVLRKHKIDVEAGVSRVEYKTFLNKFLVLDNYCDYSLLDPLSRFDEYYSSENDDEPEEMKQFEAYHDDLLEYAESLKRSELKFSTAEIDLLAEIAVKSPAVSAVRSIFSSGRLEVTIENDQKNIALLLKYMRRFFDRGVAQSIIRNQQEEDEWYWRSVMNHSYNHEFQSVIEEYLYGLLGDHGLLDRKADTEENIEALFAELLGVFSARPGRVKLRVNRRRKVNVSRLFALPYENIETEGAQVRGETIRQSFNSPFWPFIIATTSIGQEGIDFHKYCHDIMHWNLPANPVDLEQRDGRINRYNGLVVRRNIAEKVSIDDIKRELKGNDNFWGVAYRLAGNMFRANALAPHWVFPGSHKINRHMIFLPFSREKENYEALKKSLANYRVTFGQPRQADIIERLNKNDLISSDKIRELYINLMP